MVEAVICGVKFRVDFSFLVFAALIFLVKDSAVILVYFTVCLVHEIGHGLAVCLSGGRISSVAFYGMGIIMVPCRSGLLTVKKELFILLSGPAVNILLFLLLRNADGFGLFALLNLCAAVFNLLPYSSLDGGAALLLLSDSLKCGKVILVLIGIIQPALSACLFLAALYERTLIPLFCVSLFYFLSEIKHFHR